MSFFPVRKLLVPVDFSPASACAWSWAAALSTPGAERELLHVQELPVSIGVDLPPLPLPALERRELLAELRAAYPGGKARVRRGDPAAEILRRSADAELIVMGTHGRRGLSRLLLGSVCERVLRRARVPVLAVKTPWARVRSVLAPVSLRPGCRAGLALAADAAAALGASLTVLHVLDDELDAPRARRLVERLIRRLPDGLRRARARVLLRSGDRREQVLEEAKGHDLLVLSSPGRGLSRELVLGRTARRALRELGVPVLSAPAGYLRPGLRGIFGLGARAGLDPAISGERS